MADIREDYFLLDFIMDGRNGKQYFILYPAHLMSDNFRDAATKAFDEEKYAKVGFFFFEEDNIRIPVARGDRVIDETEHRTFSITYALGIKCDAKILRDMCDNHNVVGHGNIQYL